MRYLKLILFFFPAFAFGQVITNDTLPSLPYGSVFYQDFETNKTGISNFNGGTASQVGHKLQVIASGSSKGAIFDYTNEASTDYRIQMNVLDAGAGIRVYSQWATLITTIETTGWHTVKFTTDASAGAFGNKVVLAATQADTFTIEFIEYSKINEHRDIPHMGQVMDYDLSTAAIYGNSFELNVDGTDMYGTTDLENPVDGAYKKSVNTSGEVLCLGCNMFNDTSSYRVAVNVTIVDEPLMFKAVWGNAAVSPEYTASTSGWHYFDMVRRGAAASAELDGLTVNIPTAPGTIQIEDVKIWEISENLSANNNVFIGSNITPLYGNSGENTEAVVIIGGSASASLKGATVTGYNAQAGGVTYFGAAQSAGEVSAFGESATAAGWRNTALGAESFAGGQSTTAVGSGAESFTSHSVALGRGSYIAPYPVNSGTIETSNVLAVEPEKLYLGNGWAHRTPEPFSDQTRGTYTPSSTEMAIFGADAYDGRYPAWDSGTTYSINHKVFYSDSIYYSLTNSNLNNTPTGDLSNWSVLHYDSQGAAADFNVNGGHLGLYSGRGTGTGEGGELRFYTAPTAGSKDPNEKNDSVLSGKFVSDDTVTDGTDLYLLDRSDDTMKRVKVRAAAPAAGTKGIISMNALYIE